MSLVEKLIWCNTIVAIIGTYLNAKQKRIGFIIWMLTNAAFVGYNVYINCYAQASLFFVYFGLALYGWISWGKTKTEEKKEEVQTT